MIYVICWLFCLLMARYLSDILDEIVGRSILDIKRWHQKNYLTITNKENFEPLHHELLHSFLYFLELLHSINN